jgi:hypothetical protein
MDSLFSFPVGLFDPLQQPVYPGALRVAANRIASPLDRISPINDLSFLLSWTTSCANGSSRPE